jgi:hypothetical protein
MNKIVVGFFAILFLLLIVFYYDFPLTKTKIVGTYINTNYENEPCCMEAPHQPDTLTLNSDYTFTSNFYGQGTYTTNGLDIHWKYQMGQAGFHTSFSNKLFEEPRIILNYDFNHHYKKTK